MISIRPVTAAALILPLLTLGCTWMPPPPAITSRITDTPRLDRLTYCFGHGCRQSQTIAFQPAEWREVRAVFAERVDPAAERQRIGTAIGLMERLAAPHAGTKDDRAGTTPSILQDATMGAQLDCYDETINTTNFLRLLAADGLLRHHTVAAPVHRFWVAGDIIHATATVVDKTTGARYAVDSTFRDNGGAAETPPVEAWIAGWTLESAAQSTADSSAAN